MICPGPPGFLLALAYSPIEALAAELALDRGARTAPESAWLEAAR